MRSLFITLLFLLVYEIGISQDFRRGYVILLNGDSLAGEVSYRHTFQNTDFCKFRSAGSRTTSRYTPKQIKAYGFINDKRFESRILSDNRDSVPVFLQVIVKGYLSLLKSESLYYLENSSHQLTPLPRDEDKLINTDKGLFSKRDLRYIGLLNLTIADCNLSANAVKYTEQDLRALVQNYNRCHRQEGQYYTEKKKDALLTFQVFGGFQNKQITFPDFPSLQGTLPFGGAGIEFSSPKIFDRLFLSLDVFYSHERYSTYSKQQSGQVTVHNDYTFQQSLLKVPVSFRYNFSNDYNSFYVRIGAFAERQINAKLSIITEREFPSDVKTAYSDFSIKQTHTGYHGAVGYTRGIYGRTKGYIELRFEKSSGYVEAYNSQGLSIITGLKF